ncbi:MAG: hypothetical protein IJU70_06475 [Lentisphaeria bacterium]|nr:hypothetical protein [Lentisphaeria bacterium]
MAIQYDPFLTKILRRISTALIEAAAQAAADQAASETAQELEPRITEIAVAAATEAVGAVATELEETREALETRLEEAAARTDLLWRQLQFRTAEGTLSTGTLECGDAFQEEPYPLDWIFGEWGTFGLILRFENWTVQP